MSLSLECRTITQAIGTKRLAMKLGVEFATVARWIDGSAEPPPYVNAAILNVRNNRSPADPLLFTDWRNVSRLGVSERTFFRWRDTPTGIPDPPRIARHAMREMMMRRGEFRQHHAEAFLLIGRSHLRKWTDRTFHDPKTGDTLNAAMFETLAEMGLVAFSPKFKRVILTRKGRDRLNKWNREHD